MRFFNTADPTIPEDHYCIPPLERLDLSYLCALVRDNCYFELYAPRQTGKTSTLLAFRDYLNSGVAGDYRCVYANFEAGQAAREDMVSAMRAILNELATQANLTLGDEFPRKNWPDFLAEAGPYGALGSTLTRWAELDPRPLVLLIDEIDSLVGDTFLSVLRQLRAGFDRRPHYFPQSVILCGTSKVRDYRIHSGSTNETIAGGVPFNIIAESFHLEDFSQEDVATLLAQHTEETGQAFSPEAVEAVWNRTEGQPWLVNALAKRLCFEKDSVRTDGRAIEKEDVHGAEEDLILARETHLEQLADKLKEDRVRRVIEPILQGGEGLGLDASYEDFEYVQALGLIGWDPIAPLRIPNPIYAEVISRSISHEVQRNLP